MRLLAFVFSMVPLSIIPICVLLIGQARFVAYHDEKITYVQQILVSADVCVSLLALFLFRVFSSCGDGYRTFIVSIRKLIVDEIMIATLFYAAILLVLALWVSWVEEVIPPKTCAEQRCESRRLRLFDEWFPRNLELPSGFDRKRRPALACSFVRA